MLFDRGDVVPKARRLSIAGEVAVGQAEHLEAGVVEGALVKWAPSDPIVFARDRKAAFVCELNPLDVFDRSPAEHVIERPDDESDGTQRLGHSSGAQAAIDEDLRQRGRGCG